MPHGQFRVWLLVQVTGDPHEGVKKLIPLIFTQQQPYPGWSITRIDAIDPARTRTDLVEKYRPTAQTSFNLFLAVEAQDRDTFTKAAQTILKTLGVSDPTGFVVSGTISGPDWGPLG